MGWSWGQSQVATALRSRDQGVSGDEGRSCALGQRPLVDSAAAAATQSPCPAAVASGVVSPGHVDRVESTALHRTQARSSLARPGFEKLYRNQVLFQCPSTLSTSFSHLTSKW